MSTIFPVDHHATFHGWTDEAAEETANTGEWTHRRSVGFILALALVSWILVLSPFILLG